MHACSCWFGMEVGGVQQAHTCTHSAVQCSARVQISCPTMHGSNILHTQDETKLVRVCVCVGGGGGGGGGHSQLQHVAPVMVGYILQQLNGSIQLPSLCAVPNFACDVIGCVGRPLVKEVCWDV